MINLIKQEVYKNNPDSEIIAIFETGSQLFRDLGAENDLDYLVICKNLSRERTKTILDIEGKAYDIICYEEQYLIDTLEFKEYAIKPDNLYNYFIKINKLVDGAWLYEFNFLNKEIEYKSFIKNQYKNTIGKRINRSKLTKHWVHYYIIFKFFENDSTTITEEMLQDINKLYDSSEGSLEIINSIEEKINALP